jgi:hypothetical protein
MRPVTSYIQPIAGKQVVIEGFETDMEGVYNKPAEYLLAETTRILKPGSERIQEYSYL